MRVCRRPMSRLQSVSYLVFLLLMSSQHYIKGDGWRYVVIGLAVLAIAGMFVSRRRNCA